MIIKTTSGEQRSYAQIPNFSSRDIRTIYNIGGVIATTEGIFGLPALTQAIRVCAVNVASLTPYVVDVSNPNDPKPKPNAWQSELFSQFTGPFNVFNFLSDISSNVDGYGNAFVQKFKSQGKVVDLQVIDPDRVAVQKDNGSVTYKVYREDNSVAELTDSDILHIRGYTPHGSASGMSLVQLFRKQIGNMLDGQEFIGAFFRQGSVVPYAITVPGEVDQNEAEEILAVWESTHGGLQNMHRPGLLSNGAGIEKLGMSLADAEWVSNQKWTVEEAARMANFPSELLQPSNAETTPIEQVLLKLLTLYIRPRAERVLAAINADEDLFPGTLALELDYSKLREADLTSQGNFLLKMRQAGIITQNEARARIGFAPMDGGDELLPIPVGAPGIDKQGNPSEDGSNQ